MVIPFGCDFAYQNAKADLDSTVKLIEYFNLHNTANIKLQLSTPDDYISAVKAEKIKWPTRYEDEMPYSEESDDYWTGYFSSRPTFKKEIKDASSFLHGEYEMFAKKVIQKNVTDKEVSKIMDTKKEMTE